MLAQRHDSGNPDIWASDQDDIAIGRQWVLIEDVSNFSKA